MALNYGRMYTTPGRPSKPDPNLNFPLSGPGLGSGGGVSAFDWGGLGSLIGNIFTGGGGSTPGTGGANVYLGMACQTLPEPYRGYCQTAQSLLTGGGGSAGSGSCQQGYVRDPISGRCLSESGGNGVGGGGDAYVSPGEFSVGQRGIRLPMAVDRRTLVCPKFADNKTGILWMDAMTGDVVCLPRGVSGRKFGFVRKNPPRRKAYITAAEKKHLDIHTRVKKKARDFASKAGYTCKSKGSGR